MTDWLVRHSLFTAGVLFMLGLLELKRGHVAIGLLNLSFVAALWWVHESRFREEPSDG